MIVFNCTSNICSWLFEAHNQTIINQSRASAIQISAIITLHHPTSAHLSSIIPQRAFFAPMAIADYNLCPKLQTS